MSPLINEDETHFLTRQQQARLRFPELQTVRDPQELIAIDRRRQLRGSSTQLGDAIRQTVAKHAAQNPKLGLFNDALRNVVRPGDSQRTFGPVISPPGEELFEPGPLTELERRGFSDPLGLRFREPGLHEIETVNRITPDERRTALSETLREPFEGLGRTPQQRSQEERLKTGTEAPQLARASPLEFAATTGALADYLIQNPIRGAVLGAEQAIRQRDPREIARGVGQAFTNPETTRGVDLPGIRNIPDPDIVGDIGPRDLFGFGAEVALDPFVAPALAPRALTAGARGATTFRDVTRNVPIGASIRDVSQDQFQDALNHLSRVVQEEGLIRRTGTAAREISEGRGRQARGIGEGAQEAAQRGAGGEEIAQAARAGAFQGGEGSLRQTKAGPIEIAPEARDALFQEVHNRFMRGELQEFERIRLDNALGRALDGIGLQPAQIRELKKFLGEDLAEQLAGIAKTGPQSRRAVPNPPKVGPLARTTPRRSGAFRHAQKAERARDAEIREAQRLADQIANKIRSRARSRVATPPSSTQFAAARRPTTKAVEKSSAQRMFDRAKRMAPQPLEDEGLWQRIVDLGNYPRSVITSLDLSAPFRQGIVLSARNPREFWGAIWPMFRAFGSDDYARAQERVLNSGRNAIRRKRHGLYQAPLGENQRLGVGEEAFMSRLSAKTPGVQRSQRAYITFMNKLRADVYDKYADILEEAGRPEAAFDELADFVNAASGHGKVPISDAWDAAANIFFSPRLFVSRFQVAAAPFTAKDPVVRRIAAENMVAFVAEGVALLTFAEVTGLGHVELDPRSSDFGRLRLGAVRLDPWGGFQPIARAIWQTVVNERLTSSGNIQPLNRAETLGRFAQSKLAPAPAFLLDLARGETYIGEDLDWGPAGIGEQLWTRFVPLSIQDIVDGAKAEGLIGAAKTTPGILGFGVSAYVSNRDVQNRVAQEMHGKDYSDLNARQKREVDDTPEVQAKFNERPPESGSYRDQAQLLRNQQKHDDQMLEAGALSPALWDANYKSRQDQLIGARLAEFGDEPIEKPKNIYEEFINFVREQRDPVSGKIDWDEVEVYRSRLTDDQNKFIDDQTGYHDTDAVFERRQIVRELDQRQFFDIRDRVWQRIAQREGLPTEVGEFENQVRQRILQRLEERGRGLSDALIIFEQVWSEIPQVQVWSQVSNDVEQAWIESNPELAKRALKFNLITAGGLRKDEEGALLTAGSAASPP